VSFNERNTYVLSLVEEGVVHYRGRRAASAGAGDLILMNSDHALDSQRTVAGQTIAVSIPAAMLRLHFAEADDWCLVPLPTHEGSPAILRECLMTYWRTQQSPTESGYNDLAQAIIHLIGASFRQPSGRACIDSRSMHAHYLRVCAVVEEHFNNPDLSAALVADRLGISKSYLFAVMNAANTTLGRLIRDQRLEFSARLLRDPSMRSRTVYELAFAAGFQDPAHFCRRFTEKYGRSPRAFRASA
jgi:AraC-like DNA-binding protein